MTHLINFLIREVLTSRNVLAGNFSVHVGLDSTRSDRIDRDLLVAAVDRL